MVDKKFLMKKRNSYFMRSLYHCVLLIFTTFFNFKDVALIAHSTTILFVGQMDKYIQILVT